MARIHLGEFEELILLTVGVVYKNAYAVAIAQEIMKQSDRSLAISAVHRSLYRLEEKGLLTSHLSEPEEKRGGKRKRLFKITAYGKKVLDESLALRISLRNQIPDIAFR
jgi:PadR family transcriptional regulator, regulatory protein PadR